MTVITKEACVENLQEAINAEKNGADRLELCSSLDLDGLTPDQGLVEEVLENVEIPVKVMIRPRGGDFIYNRDEINKLREEIKNFRQMGVFGVVFGILNANAELDIEKIEYLSDLAKPLNVCIHKAIDVTSDPVTEIKNLKALNCVDSILTSGKARTALEGADLIKRMMVAAGEDINIIVAGKVTEVSLGQLHTIIGAKEYHGRRIVGKLGSGG